MGLTLLVGTFAIGYQLRAGEEVRQEVQGSGPKADDSESSPSATEEMGKEADPSTVEIRPLVVPRSIDEKYEDGPGEALKNSIEEIFGYGVAAATKVIFLPVGNTAQVYVEVAEYEYYIRPANTDGDFVLIDNGTGETISGTILTEKDIVLQRAEGNLVLPDQRVFSDDTDKRSYHTGILNNRVVEYIQKEKTVGQFWKTVDPETNKTIYVKRAKPEARKIPSAKEADRLTSEQVEALLADGYLTLVEVPDGHDEAGKPKMRKTHLIPKKDDDGMPLVVLWLALGGVTFTIFMKFVNFRAFRHSVDVVRGKYTDPNEPGEVSHFQALSSALSATVGLGNIAGVALAMMAGGPGAFFWMMCCGFFGMTSKFVECTLGQMYREVRPDGTVLGGPMRYLHVGLKEMKLGGLGAILALLFTVLCIFASFAGGNMFQSNQSAALLVRQIQKGDHDKVIAANEALTAARESKDVQGIKDAQKEKDDTEAKIESEGLLYKAGYGVVLTFFVGLVILGGIKRIGATAEKIVPFMCAVYLLACVVIIGIHITEVPALIGSIFTEAFSPTAFGGGMIGVLVIGVQRAAFSNEAGIGSASIAHSAAKTSEPVREGVVALLEPFVDTIIVCSMTALVILITGVLQESSFYDVTDGAVLTGLAFAREIPRFDLILSIAVVLFAFSTIISWSYYGERCWVTLFGDNSSVTFKMVFLTFTFFGTIFSLQAVIDFSDMAVLAMAFPNILGLLILMPKVGKALNVYMEKLDSGEFKRYDKH